MDHSPPVPALDRQAHWQGVYTAKDESQLSWRQEVPRTSLELIREYCPANGAVIDVGGGTSLLAGRLIESGYRNVTVLDISTAAIERARARNGSASEKVKWVTADVTQVVDLGEFDCWHDRAVFHFMTDPRDRRRYIELAMRSVRPRGVMVMATFALDGPEKCSGLPVQRYHAASLSSEFADGFDLVNCIAESHLTPWGKLQSFQYSVMRRKE
jgi:2-polyprenyl-3-methyl-5-hydroxy-6-metoxy-1,4-benzoquinol methylase